MVKDGKEGGYEENGRQCDEGKLEPPVRLAGFLTGKQVWSGGRSWEQWRPGSAGIWRAQINQVSEHELRTHHGVSDKLIDDRARGFKPLVNEAHLQNGDRENYLECDSPADRAPVYSAQI